MTYQLRHLGVFQEHAAAKGDFGQETQNWLDVAQAALDIRPVTGREKLRAGQINTIFTFTIATRYNPVLLPLVRVGQLRLKVDSRIFNIHAGHDVNEEHQWMIFECSEGTLDGN